MFSSFVCLSFILCPNTLIFTFKIMAGQERRSCHRVRTARARRNTHICTVRDKSPKLLIEHSTWQLPEELCEQEGHQSLPNDHPTSQPLFSFMCHIQLTVRLVCSLSHSLNPSICCSQSCRVAPFHLPWFLAMAIFCPGSLDPSW